LLIIALTFFIKEGNAQIDTVKVFGEDALLSTLYENSKSDDYNDCEIIIGEKNVKARIRVRGDSSRKFDKKSLKIKYKFKGEKRVLNLNAEFRDGSYMHQHMAAFIYRKAGIPAFNTNYKVLFINDVFQGIYLDVENIDNKYLKRNKLNAAGDLYKAKKDGANLSVYDLNAARWQKNNNRNGDKTRLKELIVNINAVPDSGFLRFVKSTFDYNNLVTSIAINSLIGNGSTYYHNYFLYHDNSNAGKWIYLPWDMDKSMGSYDTRLPYFYTSWSSMSDGGQPENPMVYRLLHDKQGFLDYKKKVRELSKTLFNKASLLPEINLLRKQLMPYIAHDLNDDVPSIKFWNKKVEKMLKFIEERPGALENQFKKYPSLFCLKNEPGYQFDRKARLTWEASITNIDSIVYHLRISPSKEFKKDVIEFNNLTKPKIVVDSLKTGRYYWHVVADNGVFKTNGFNTRNYFDVGTAVILGGEIKGNKVIKNAHVVIFKDLKIGKNSSLTFGEGAVVKVNPKVRIFNSGTLKIIGNKKKPVIFANRKKGKAWLGILSKGILEINHANFSGVTGESVVRQINGEAIMKNTCSSYNSVRETASFNICPVEVTNNVIRDSKGEGLLFLKCNGLVKNNSLFGVPDGIEATMCNDMLITENFLIDATDDGIDVNFGSNVRVSFNTAINCKDKGMSITGKENDSTIFFENNYIENCTKGIGVEGKGTVNLNGNIYYNNKNQLILENTEGLTVYSKGEYFNNSKTVNSNVIVTGQNSFSEVYLKGINIKMKVDKIKNKVSSITLTNKHDFPISLKGVSIVSGKKVLYKFNKHEVVFPSKEVLLKSKQSKSQNIPFVINDLKAKKKIKLKYKNQLIIGEEQNYKFLIGGLFIAGVIGFFIIKRKS
jgi:spore coat protein H